MKNKHSKRVRTVMEYRVKFLQTLGTIHSEGARLTTPPVASAAASEAKAPIIFRSELDYISRCILDCPNIETGGQLFGSWTEDGTPVVLFAIGPGPHANHQPTFFNQDVNYLLAVGTELKNRFGLVHIGEWHSHHQLGLARPSGHDVSTMVSTIREKHLSRFLLCIGNSNGRSSSLNPFMCDDRTCVATSWDVIRQESPVRRPVYEHMGSILVDPRTRFASHMTGTLRDEPARPRYARDSWMNEQGNGQLLNRMMLHVKSHHSRSAEVSVKLDDMGRVHIVSVDYGRNGRWEEDILFPDGFPGLAPFCRACDRTGSAEFRGIWSMNDDPFVAFVDYYDSIIRQY